MTRTGPRSVVLSGQGDEVVGLPNLAPTVAEIVHEGEENFVVWSLNEALDQIDLLVNEIGNYHGRVPVNLPGTENATQLQVNASGRWTITFRPIGVGGRRISRGELTGQGSDVVHISKAVVCRFSHDGQSNFAVWLYRKNSTDLVINEVGRYSGTVPLRGPGILVIAADGTWAMSIK